MKCPYCGSEMKEIKEGKFDYYICPNCGYCLI